MNWRVWIQGLVAAAVAGLGNGLAGLAIGIEWHKLLALLLIQMAISVGMFLKQSPLPPQRDVWTAEQRATNLAGKP